MPAIVFFFKQKTAYEMEIRLPFPNSFPTGKFRSQASGQLYTSSVDLHLSYPNTAQDAHFIAKMTGSDDLRREEQVPRWRLQPKSHWCPPLRREIGRPSIPW